jgi:hypothetical protein
MDTGRRWQTAQVGLKNCCCADLSQLHLEVRRAKGRLRHERLIIRGFSTHCGYAM